MRRQTVGQRGKPAHVRQPDGRVDLLDVAAPDMPGEDALAGVMPDIGIEQGARHPPQGADLGDPRQRRDDGLDAGDLRVGEAARLPRRAGHRMNGAIGEDERRGEIVGHLFGAKIRKDRKIRGTVRIGQLAPDRFARPIDAGDRTVAEIFGFEKLERRLW